MEVKDKEYIVAPSETLGKHHVVPTEGAKFYEHEGTVYMDAPGGSEVRMSHSSDHDTIQLTGGFYEFGTAQEYDYDSMELRNVAD